MGLTERIIDDTHVLFILLRSVHRATSANRPVPTKENVYDRLKNVLEDTTAIQGMELIVKCVHAHYKLLKTSRVI